MAPTLIKFFSEGCGICGKMAHFDQKVTEEMGFKFLKCCVDEIDDYVEYRHILLTQYPDLEGVGYPTYILVDQPGDDAQLIGYVRGGYDKGAFRQRLGALA